MSTTPATGGPVTAASLRSPRAAAVAGILFALLLGLAMALIRLAVPAEPGEAGTMLSDSDSRSMVEFALNLVPFASIAFLWFIGVIRDRVGEREDHLFATVFLGSGVLFVGMLFVGAAIAGGLTTEASQGGITWHLGHHITFTLVNVYAMRMLLGRLARPAGRGARKGHLHGGLLLDPQDELVGARG